MFNTEYSVNASLQYVVYAVTVGNKQYNIEPKTLTLTAYARKEEVGHVDLAVFESDLMAAVEPFQKATVVCVDNPVFLRLLDPKSGLSAQDVVARIKNDFGSTDDYGYAIVGREVPSLTNSGILVIATKVDPIMEIIGGIIMKRINNNEVAGPAICKMEIVSETGAAITLTPSDLLL